MTAPTQPLINMHIRTLLVPVTILSLVSDSLIRGLARGAACT